jgi:dihydrofolate synthase/folylpolyglutamate synthase
MLAPLSSVGIDRVFACAPASPRAIAPGVVAEAAAAAGLRTEVFDSVQAAVERAVQAADPEGMVVVAGSLYVVADARGALMDASERRSGGLEEGRDPAGRVLDSWSAPS